MPIISLVYPDHINKYPYHCKCYLLFMSCGKVHQLDSKVPVSTVQKCDVRLFNMDLLYIYSSPHTMMSFLPRHDAILLLILVFPDRSRVSNLVLTWTPLITSSNPSGCSAHSRRSSFWRVLFIFNIVPAWRGTQPLCDDLCMK